MPPAPTPEHASSHRRSPPTLATLVLIAGTSVMAMNIFLPMLTAIGRDMEVSPATAQYVLTLFLAATGVTQLFIGPLADRYGRRPVLLATASIYLVGTAICILAPSIEWLLAGRIIQSVSAASVALSRAIIRDLYDRSKAASMIGYVTMAMAIMPMISPSIGGLVGEAYGWRGPFVVLFVVGCAMLLLIFVDLGETHTPVKAPVSRQFQNYFSLIREPAIWGYVLCGALGSGAYFAFLGGAPFVGTEIVGVSPATLGLYFALVAVGYMAGNFVSGRYSERIGIEPMMFYGGLVACLGVGIALLLMSTLTPRLIYLFGPMMLVGFGNGMMLPNANAGAVSVRPDLAGSASGLAGFMQVGGGATLAALCGYTISVENQALPLYFIMFGSSFAGALVGALMHRTARRNR